MKRLAISCFAVATCTGCANQNLGYDLLFGMMQPFYSDGGPGLWDQKRDFDNRVETWRDHDEARPADE